MATHAGVVGLKKSNLDALLGKEALGLGQVDGGVVSGGVPVEYNPQTLAFFGSFFSLFSGQHRPVGKKGNLISGHFDGGVGRWSEKLLWLVFTAWLASTVK